MEGGVLDDGKWVAAYYIGESSRFCQYRCHASPFLLPGLSALLGRRKGGGPGLRQFEVRYKFVVSAQP